MDKAEEITNTSSEVIEISGSTATSEKIYEACKQEGNANIILSLVKEYNGPVYDIEIMAMTYGVKHKNEDLVDLLLEKGSRGSERTECCLIEGCNCTTVEIVKKLLDNGWNLNNPRHMTYAAIGDNYKLYEFFARYQWPETSNIIN